ncbi:hypothetical protein MFLAVUS_009189 [Mucor flavus]|uniref:Single-stranded DNA binding protein n=1 Tax=Mucor flavus TaxID=439312 RepID=A0ABP9Z996_9FUNG
MKYFDNKSRNPKERRISAIYDLKLEFGEAKLETSTFKIDYKVGCTLKGKFFTLSCIVVGKFVEPEKVREDHHKLLLEGNTIINNIIKEFKFIDPRSCWKSSKNKKIEIIEM